MFLMSCLLLLLLQDCSEGLPPSRSPPPEFSLGSSHQWFCWAPDHPLAAASLPPVSFLPVITHLL